MNQHEDFGEKIGGARKDLWKERGLCVDDLDAMNDREAEKFVKKDNIWKKPDYQALLDSGLPLGVVFFIKKARDSINASPQYLYGDKTPEKRLARQREYIQTVRELQSVVSEARTVEDAMKAFERFFVENGYFEKVQEWGCSFRYQATEKGGKNPSITKKLADILLIRSPEAFERNFTQKAQKEQFGISKEQKVPRGYAIRFNDGKYTYSKNNVWLPNTYYVVKGHSILQTNFETREAALKWVQDFARGQNKSGKTRFVPPQLANIQRTGPDYRNGVDITGQHYLDTFGFRGGEFGNWMNQNDRQASLNMGFEALKDLASVLKISDRDISYQGTLAIAFGARGSGNAAAHYEPLRKVINLTKMHGAGSLAHEWWHGLDDYLGTKMGARGMLSEQPRLYAPFQKLINTMKYKPETPQIGRVETNFYQNSVRMAAECERDGGYWDSNTEMTARAFACYVKDKLPYASDYLVGHADCAVKIVANRSGEMEVLKAFPQGEERKAINAVFDEIVADLKREQILTHEDGTLPLFSHSVVENEQISFFSYEPPKPKPVQAIRKTDYGPEL